LLSAGIEEKNIHLPCANVNRWWDLDRNHNLDQIFDPAEQSRLADARIPLLNEKKCTAFQVIIHSIQNNNPKLFFLNGPAGTGKTFLYNTITHYLCGLGKIVLCVASSGIACHLFLEGRTAHSQFNIPLEINEDSICSIKKQSTLAQLLKNTDCIIWKRFQCSTASVKKQLIALSVIYATVRSLWVELLLLMVVTFSKSFLSLSEEANQRLLKHVSSTHIFDMKQQYCISQKTNSFRVEQQKTSNLLTGY
jgi:hypothetical protein